MFTVLIMAGSFLFQLTRYISEGISPAVVAQLAVVLLPGIVVKTFPMAVLLSGLLSFGRLSGDSEVVALKAAGVSIGRIMIPVACFGVSVALVTLVVNEYLVPKATQQAVGIKKSIESELNGKTAQEMSQAVYQSGKLKASFWASDFSFVHRTLSRVVVTIYDEKEVPSAYLFVNEMEYTDKDHWEIRGGGRLTPANGSSSVAFDNAFPAGVPELASTPEELLAKSLRDLDALPMRDMKQQIDKLRMTQKMTPDLVSQIVNLEFGYWNKLALPLAALVFGLVGAPLGIRSHRVAMAAGFWQAVLIILLYFFLTNVMGIAAQGGRVPAFVASFLPISVGLVVGLFLIHRRNN